MVRDLASDPYVVATTSVPGDPSPAAVQAYLDRQHERRLSGVGWSFGIARADTDAAVGQIGLWLDAIRHGRASCGYCVAPAECGAGFAGQALVALTEFAWAIPALHRLELCIKPWNAASRTTPSVP